MNLAENFCKSSDFIFQWKFQKSCSKIKCYSGENSADKYQDWQTCARMLQLWEEEPTESRINLKRIIFDNTPN